MNVHPIRRILCVDDDVSFRQAIVMSLRTTFSNVLDCNDEKTVDIAERYEPNLIVIGVSLPSHDGLTPFYKLRNHELLRYTPIIFVSSSCNEAIMDHYVKMGAIGAVPKLTNMDRLPAAISIIWNHHHSSLKHLVYHLLHLD